MTGSAHRGRFATVVRSAVASRYATVVVALVALSVMSPILAPGSLDPSALLSMLPFAAVLAVVAAGQTIVVQQAGIDLSVAGSVSLSAMLMNTVAAGDDGRTVLGVAVALAGAVIGGVVTGIAVAWFGVTPLVATLAVNGLLLGAVLALSGGQSASPAPPIVNHLALDRTLGVPNLVIVATAVLAVLIFATTRTVFGRRFIAVGVSSRAARAAGIRTVAYTVGAFALAGACYGVGGIMLAAFSGVPSVFVGSAYLLPSIAAVVIGGTALSGGKGSIAATALGALFLTQLDQVVSGLGGPNAVQMIVQGLVILFALTLRGLLGALRSRVYRRPGSDGAPPPPEPPRRSTSSSGTALTSKPS